MNREIKAINKDLLPRRGWILLSACMVEKGKELTA